ncbi:hypothetical protein K2173_003463 [Erythroxylum novogranatense]|uniref:Dof zinc finger protein n=1 Tax=Erythroxylum novogranatense TaxID=1862640 RepID=A0AAV8S8W6_9ROSI|nr:hypothetical protein K2173_003463 [Erythroxylum novogranatense]
MDAASWPQDIKAAKPMEEMGSDTCTRPVVDRKARPQEQLNCPRCNSTNTKFCYYNNYSLTQPRYFCKTCRRYWTEGGSLRNVPVGGGSRKNKRSSSQASSKIPDLNPPSLSQFSSHENPKAHEGQDLNLGFPTQGLIPHYVELPKTEASKDQHNNTSPSSSSYNSSHLSALELLRTGITSRGLSSFIPAPMPDSNTLYSTGFPLQLQEFKPSLGFSVDGLGLENRYSGGHQENGGRGIPFPFGGMKQLSSPNEVDQNKGQGTSGGYWNGMLGGGSW